MNPVIRPAEPGDLRGIAHAMHLEPLADVVGIVGGEQLAQRIGVELLKLEGIQDPARPWVVAEHQRTFVGALQWSNSSLPSPVTMRMRWTVVKAIGLSRLPSALGRQRARGRVQIKPPRDAFHIREIHVLPEYRNRGVGAALLKWAEIEARHRDFDHMALVTHTSNPAVHLYERDGFRIVDTKTDPKFENYTGIAGRYLMVKEIERYVV